MVVFGGRVREARTAIGASVDDFVAGCERRFVRLYGVPPGDAERGSWRRSWPHLVEALCRAGMADLWLGLEYGLPGSGERVDALIAAARPDGGLTVVVVELKQWSNAELVLRSDLLVEVGDRVTAHPCRQAAGYVRYLRTWLDPKPLALQVRGVAFLHGAPRALTDRLRAAIPPGDGSGEIPLIGDEYRDGTPERLAGSFGLDGLRPPRDEQINTFLNLPHRPAPALFRQLADVLRSNANFRLIGAQQDAFLALLDAAGKADRNGQRHVVAVRGGPGTGKTVIAVRLLAELAVRRGRPARYYTPSRTLRLNLIRAARLPELKGLFRYVDDYSSGDDPQRVVLVDEAQRVRIGQPAVTRMLRNAQVSAFFLDERQIIRPREGITVEELRRLADRNGAGFTPVDLASQFRCGGSQRYQNWLSALLSPEAAPVPWPGGGYDIAPARHPVELESWIGRHNHEGKHEGKTARITAGFCWDWHRTAPRQPLRDDVCIDWTDPDTGRSGTWRRPWNADEPVVNTEGQVAPEKAYWAADPGGENQVGCIYTAQALEYAYGGVIIGPDLVRRGDRWVADAGRSRDPVMRGLTPEEYLPLALNTYWVLLTRAALGCRVYSVDPETQAFLSALLPTSSHVAAE